MLKLENKEFLYQSSFLQEIKDSKEKIMRSFYIYILKCKNGSYYVGHTNDPDRRFDEHNKGLAACAYTFSRRPVRMVYLCEFPNRAQAFLIERKVKQWTRKKKEALIEGHLNLLVELSKKKF